MLEVIAVQVVSIRSPICYNEQVKKVSARRFSVGIRSYSHNAMFVGRVVASIFQSR